MTVRAILLDVEGTTTPIDFVAETLFPFARARLRAFLDARGDALAEDLRALEAEREREPDADAPRDAAGYLLWLADRDRKSTALKSIQGKIWEQGYREGALRGEVYEDVPRAFERWRERGTDVAIFSSGSVLAQRLLFSSTAAGDLTPYLRAHFDTTVGAKGDAASYREIASRLGLAPADVLFVSDVTAELDAAHEAGMATRLSLRPGNRPQPAGHATITTFDEL